MKSMRKLALRLCFVGIVLLSIGGFGAAQAEAAIVPGHEIKFNVKPDLFPEAELQRLFSAVKKDEVKIYYYDTPSKDFTAADYNHRIRVYKGSNKIDVTYKKRFPNTPLANALAIAESHGFTGSESNYKFEVDIKGGKDVFTISRKEKLKATADVSYTAVDTAAAKQLLLANVPNKILNWDSASWYQNTLAQAVAYGPAKATTYTGSYAGYDADIEVWEYLGETIVEISTKEDSAATAATIQTKWHDQLAASGYLSADQRGKTAFVMGE